MVQASPLLLVRDDVGETLASLLPSAVQSICTFGTGLPFTSSTRTVGGTGSVVPAGAVWLLPATMLMVTGVTVMVNTAESAPVPPFTKSTPSGASPPVRALATTV